MTIQNQILGYNLTGEGVAQLLDMARVSISVAAANDTDAVQLAQLNEIRDALQAQLDAIDSSHHSISEVHVDSTSADLATALALGTYSNEIKAWTFTDGTVIGAGDSVILQAAADPKDRSWIHTGAGAGDTSDFERLNSDIQALINAGVAAVVDSLRDGVPAAADTLNKLFTRIVSAEAAQSGFGEDIATLQAAIATLTAEVNSKVRVFYLQQTFVKDVETGIIHVTVANPANFEKARVTVKENLLSGGTRKIPDTSFVETTSDAQLLLQTFAPSFEGKEVLIIVEA